MDASEYEPQVVELPSETESRSSHEEDKVSRSSRGEDDVTYRSSSRGGSVTSDSDTSSSDEDGRASNSSDVKEKPPAEKRVTSNGKTVEGLAGSVELTAKEREELWVQKLGEMRQRYLASMTQEEREDFFKRLEV